MNGIYKENFNKDKKETNLIGLVYFWISVIVKVFIDDPKTVQDEVEEVVDIYVIKGAGNAGKIVN